MRVGTFDLPGFEEALQAIRALGTDVAYFLLFDTSVPKQDVRLDRLDFDAQRLASFMSAPPLKPSTGQADGDPSELDPDDLEPDDDDDDEDDDEGTDEEAPAEAESVTPPPPPGFRYFGQIEGLEFTHKNMLEAVCTWLTRSALALGTAAPAVKLRVQALGNKGTKVISTSSFWVQNLGYRKDLDALALAAGLERQNPTQGQAGATSPTNPGGAPSSGSPVQASVSMVATAPVPAANPVPAPPVTSVPPPNMLIYPAGYQDGTLFGTAGAFRALNESYVQFGQVMNSGVANLQEMMTRMLEARGVELVQAREQVNKLLNDILNFRIRETQGETAAIQLQVDDHRTALMRDAVNQMGETARAIFMSRGMPPAMAELMSHLSGNRELMDALQHPSVRELLKDPQAQKALTDMLLQAGQMSQADTSGQPAPRQLPAGSAPPPAPPQATLYNTSHPAPPAPGYPPAPGTHPYGFAGGYPASPYPGGVPAPGASQQPSTGLPGSPNPYHPQPPYQPPGYPPPGTMPPAYPGYPPGWPPPGPPPGYAYAMPPQGGWPQAAPGAPSPTPPMPPSPGVSGEQTSGSSPQGTPGRIPDPPDPSRQTQ